MGAANDLASTHLIAQAMGAEMNELGIHLNFSAVVDINTNPKNPVIGFRSFGENPLLVSKQSNEMIKGMQNFNVLTCMRSEEHTSELQSRPHLVCRLLLEKKKQQ